MTDLFLLLKYIVSVKLLPQNFWILSELQISEASEPSSNPASLAPPAGTDAL